jgi:hypothetical protein
MEEKVENNLIRFEQDIKPYKIRISTPPKKTPCNPLSILLEEDFKVTYNAASGRLIPFLVFSKQRAKSLSQFILNLS